MEVMSVGIYSYTVMFTLDQTRQVVICLDSKCVTKLNMMSVLTITDTNR